MPADLKALYDRANNPYYYEMAIQHVFFGPSDRVYGDYDMSMTSYPDISAAYGASQTIDPAPTFQSSIQNFLTVNGQYNPSVNIVAGSTALVRLLYSGPWRFLVLMIEKVDGAHVCNITLLARDGIFQQAPYLNVTRMAFHPGRNPPRFLFKMCHCL